MPFRALIDHTGDRVLLALSGEFTLDAGQRFEEALEEIARAPVSDLIVDLSGITFMDSTAAYMLLQAYKRFSSGATVMFEGGSGDIQRMFESSGLNAILPIAFPGAAHPSTAPGAGQDHDWTGNPTHTHHGAPYIGIPRPGMSQRHRG
jgi:anti-anti-sigma factor